MFKKLCLATLAAGTLLVPATLAQDEETPTFLGGTFSANVTIATDYTFRGISQNSGDPAVQGGFDWASDLFYAGTWASTVDFNDDFGTLAAGVAAELGVEPGILDTADSAGPSDGSQIEIDLYGGITPSIGDLSLDFGVIYYLYAGAPQDSDDVIVATTLTPDQQAIVDGLGLAPGQVLLDFPDQNYVELHAAGSYPIGPAEIGFNLTYSPDYYFETGDVLIPDVSISFPLGGSTTIAGGDFSLAFSSNIGYLAFLDDEVPDGGGFGEDYWDFGVGVTATWFGVDFDVRYIDTFGLGGNGSTGIFSVSKSF
ncbi:MAG: TorF family putative porin [Pseudomonadota bacterium]